jgi:acetolactate synthase regulatory subunit
MPTTNLTLHVRPESDALQRVVTLCRRRRLEICALHYRSGELALTIRGEHARARLAAEWLGGLVDVLGVVRCSRDGTSQQARLDHVDG